MPLNCNITKIISEIINQHTDIDRHYIGTQDIDRLPVYKDLCYEEEQDAKHVSKTCMHAETECLYKKPMYTRARARAVQKRQKEMMRGVAYLPRKYQDCPELGSASRDFCRHWMA